MSLVVGIWVADFLHNTPYRDMFPPRSMFLSHPFAYIGRWIEIYDLHVAYVSAQTAEKRKQKVDDVQKRSEYRKAHGLDQDEGVFGGWTAKGDTEPLQPALREGNVQFGAQPGPETAADLAHDVKENVVGQAGESEEAYVEFDGKKQPMRRKWFGIW